MFETELAIIRNYVDSLPAPNAEMKDVEFQKASIARWAASEIEMRIVGEAQFADAFYPSVATDYVPQSAYEIVCWYIFDMEYLMNIRKVPSANLIFDVAHKTGCDILHLLNEHGFGTQK